MNEDAPHGKGWRRQAARWRLYISLADWVAHAVGREARRLGVAPSVLVAMIVGEWAAAREEDSDGQA